MRPVDVIIPTLSLERAVETIRLAADSAFHPDVRWLPVVDEHRGGFTETVNRGLSQVRSDCDIFLLNDDVYRFQAGWLRILQDILYLNPRNGLVGPTGRCSSLPGKGRQGEYGLRLVPNLSFWATLIRREVFNALGPLDVRYKHYNSDNVYCRAAAERGWHSVWAKSVYLWHTHHGSGVQSKWKKHDR